MASLKVYNTSFLTPTPHICTTAGSWSVPTSVRVYNGTSWVTVYTAVAASIINRDLSTGGPEGEVYSLYYRLSSNGNAYNTASGTSGLLESWLDTGTNADFQVKATLTSGSGISGTLGSWLALTTDRAWSLSSTGDAAATITVEIRNATTLAVLTSATISYDINVIPGGSTVTL